MGIMDKFLDKMKFGDPDDDGQLYDGYDDDARDICSRYGIRVGLG